MEFSTFRILSVPELPTIALEEEGMVYYKNNYSFMSAADLREGYSFSRSFSVPKECNYSLVHTVALPALIVIEWN